MFIAAGGALRCQPAPLVCDSPSIQCPGRASPAFTVRPPKDPVSAHGTAAGSIATHCPPPLKAAGRQRNASGFERCLRCLMTSLYAGRSVWPSQARGYRPI